MGRRRSLATAAVALALTLVAAVAAAAAAAPASAADPREAVHPWVPDGAVTSVAVSGSTAYVGGSFDSVGPYDGTFGVLDAATGDRETGWPDVGGSVYDAASDGAGGWYIAGSFESVGGVPRTNLAHVMGDGTVDPRWAPSTDYAVGAVAFYDGVVYAGGQFSSVNGTTRRGLVALDAVTGTLLQRNYETDGYVTDFTVGLQPAGAVLLVGGDFGKLGSSNRRGIAAIALDTGAVVDYPASVDGRVETLEEVGGTLYAGGSFKVANGLVGRVNIAAFSTQSGQVQNWNPKLPSTAGVVSDITVGESVVYVNGINGKVNEGMATEATRSRVAAFDAVTGTVTGWQPRFEGADRPNDIAVKGNRVFLAGEFGSVNGAPRTNVAAVRGDTGELVPWSEGVPGDVNTLVVEGDDVVIGGFFLGSGAVTRRGVYAVDLTTGRPTDFDPDVSGTVRAVAVGNGSVWVGGRFTQVNGDVTRVNLANFEPATGRVGSFDHVFEDRVGALAVDGQVVYAGGNFIGVDNDRRRRVAAFRDEPGTPGTLLGFDPSVDGEVRALAVAHGRVYIGGDFTSVQTNTVPRRSVAAVDPGTGAPFAWNPSPDYDVHAIAAHGPAVFLGGRFDELGDGTKRRGLAAIDVVTGKATAWDARLNGTVAALATDGEALFVAGAFSEIGGAARRQLASVGLDDARASAWDPDPERLGGTVQALAVTPGGWLVAGGGFILRSGERRTGRLAAFPLFDPRGPGGGPDGPGDPGPGGGGGGDDPPGGGGGPVPPGGGADAEAPRLSGARLTPARVRVGSRTALTFRSSEAGTVAVTFDRALPGRRVTGAGAGCRPVKKRPRRRGCTAYRRAGTLAPQRVGAGPVRLVLNGRVGRRRLAAGTYRLTLVATDATGNRSRPMYVKLTVTPRRPARKGGR